MPVKYRRIVLSLCGVFSRIMAYLRHFVRGYCRFCSNLRWTCAYGCAQFLSFTLGYAVVVVSTAPTQLL
ncbi:hypothetical protein OLMES_2306 [Oleiphilus messinensis]|uniref:Uncharacterized protein n=1 Tax=Oleiphilus messinensis TaxID=141451 RepID=A0A1Y0I849_9GAMM|nr:hypothetical protein OLMES_2306 [Oleiphilus messinensis]